MAPAPGKALVTLLVERAHASGRQSMRSRFSLWLSRLYVRWQVSRGVAVIVVGLPGSGKSTLLKNAGLILIGQPVSPATLPAPGPLLPKGPFAIDEPMAFDKEWVSNAIEQVRTRGFGLAIQHHRDLEQLGIVDALFGRERLLFFYLDQGVAADARPRRDLVLWLRQHANRADVAKAFTLRA